MVNKKFYWIVAGAAAIVVAVLLLSGVLNGRDGRDGRDGLGAQVGNDHYENQIFRDGFTGGGQSLNASSTLYIARTITAAEFCNNSYIHVNASTTAALHLVSASINLTFPATSTLFGACLNYEGAEKTITFRNSSVTAATTTEIVAGTGCDAMISENTGADDEIDGLNEARITIRRTTDAFSDGGSVDCIILIEESTAD